MRMFELLPKPLGSLFRKLTHFACNSPAAARKVRLPVKHEETPSFLVLAGRAMEAAGAVARGTAPDALVGAGTMAVLARWRV